MSDSGKDPYNRGGMIVFMATMVATVVFMIYISYFHPGVHYDTIRERGAAVELATFDPGTVEKPWVASADMIEYGTKKYGTYCASCHGKTGAGNGPSAAGLNPSPSNLLAGKWKHGGDAISLYKILKSGSSGTAMAAYGGTFSSGEIWALVHFIESITKNKKEISMADLESFAKAQ